MDRGSSSQTGGGGGGRRRCSRRRVSAFVVASAALAVASSSASASACFVPESDVAGSMRAATIVAKSVKSRGAGGAIRAGQEGRREGRRDAAAAHRGSRGSAGPLLPGSLSSSLSSMPPLLAERKNDGGGGAVLGRRAAPAGAAATPGRPFGPSGGWMAGGRNAVSSSSVPVLFPGARIRPPGTTSQGALFSTVPLPMEAWDADPHQVGDTYPVEDETRPFNGIGSILFDGRALTEAANGAGAALEDRSSAPHTPPPSQEDPDDEKDPLPPQFQGAVVVESSDLSRVVRPLSTHDFLVGRAKLITSYPGNVRFRSYVDEHCGEYVDANRTGKGKVISRVQADLNARGGTFLRKLDKKEGGDGENNGKWAMLDEREIRKKISEALRAAGKKRGGGAAAAAAAGAKKEKAEVPPGVADATNAKEVTKADARPVNGASDNTAMLSDASAPAAPGKGEEASEATTSTTAAVPEIIDILVPDDRPPIVPNGLPPLSTEPIPAPSDDDPLYEGLTSRPAVDSSGNISGNWNPSNPLAWSANFGRRTSSDAARLEKLVRLRPGDEGYFDTAEVDARVPDVTIVRTVEDAKIVMSKLMDPANRNVHHACDTEVMDIDLKKVGPVGNGYVTCISVYSGDNFDYGLGKPPGGALWVDNLDDAAGVLQEFKDFFECAEIKKVWHNYGFDRHVLWNEGIDCKGLGGDTMHMARLQDTSRSRSSGPNGGEGYSLEALTASLLGRRKKPMKELFGEPRLRKDGTPGSIVDLPPVERMQRDPRHRRGWIMYSAYDAEGTYKIHEKLLELLKEKPWVQGRKLDEYYVTYMAEFAEVLTDMERRGIRVDARDYLAKVEVQAREDRAYHTAAFQKWAEQQIGPDGLALNPASSTQLQTFLFGGAENVKTRELTEKVRVFRVPREEVSDEAMEGYKERERKLREEADPALSEGPEEDHFDKMNAAELKEICKENGLKVSGKKADLQQRLREYYVANEQALASSSSGVGSDPAYAPVSEDDYSAMSEKDLRDACAARSLSDEGSRGALVERLRSDSQFAAGILYELSPSSEDGYRTIAEALKNAVRGDGNEALKRVLAEQEERAGLEPKYVDVTVTSLGMEPEKYTAGGSPSVTADVLRKLAGDPFADPPKYGTAFDFFGGGEKGHDACVALYSLTAIGSIDTMIANFLTSLQSLADENERVHGSVNLNTETGRLSSRRPNLQNQPALEKDKYKIRKAFQSSPGNNLIVADYGQLELRLLASMTGCTSMIEAFEAGGDFHSRTALGMFDYIQKKVDDGECLLEWDYSKGEPDKPMLKDEFASERRKAKTLNFSIAYGKTPHGLSQDWGVSRDEAQEMLDAWYRSRPEVLEWQTATKAIARKEGYTRTLMGRYRQLPDAMGKDRKLIGHAERASINTPIQGGAADVVMMAMLKINSSEKLKRLGWILLMQIHDEVILEGPEETAEEAFKEVIQCMESPWVFGLDKTAVPLLVDGSYTHKNWYDAK